MKFKIATLVFIKNQQGEHLLIQRVKAPNLGKWSPIGGKLMTELGESPFECAIRETMEETGHELEEKDLHLYGYISEKDYEGSGHWLMFMFDCLKPIEALPPTGNEGAFGFFSRDQIEEIEVPPSDRTLVWPFYDTHKTGFAALRAECDPTKALKLVVEETFGSS